MNNKLIRVLHITEVLSAAGIESFILNMYRHIDRSKVQFDFLVLRDQKEFYDEEIEKLGGKKYCIHSSVSNTWFRVLDEARKIKRFLKEHRSNTVHIHYTTPLRAPYLLAAKQAGVPVRIYHAHSAEVSGKSSIKLLVYKYYRAKIALWGTDYFACSNAAAEWIFPPELIYAERVKIIHNGIDTLRFRFNEMKRKTLRKQWGVDGNFTLIHTGRFIEQKNQKFVLKVFAELRKKHTNVKLLFLGTGDMMDEVKMFADVLGVQKDIHFLGIKANVEDYLCAADCYVMPSLYEGLPVAAVEAQCSGLPCVFSKNITEEIALTKEITFLSLDAPIDMWTAAIWNYYGYTRNDLSGEIKEKNYDVQVVANELQQFYLNYKME